MITDKSPRFRAGLDQTLGQSLWPSGWVNLELCPRVWSPAGYFFDRDRCMSSQQKNLVYTLWQEVPKLVFVF